MIARFDNAEQKSTKIGNFLNSRKFSQRIH